MNEIANCTIGIALGTNGITNGTTGKTLNDIGIPMLPLGNPEYTQRLQIFAMRLLTGIDRNGPNNQNGLPESTSIFLCRLYMDRVAFNSYRKCLV